MGVRPTSCSHHALPRRIYPPNRQCIQLAHTNDNLSPSLATRLLDVCPQRLRINDLAHHLRDANFGLHSRAVVGAKALGATGTRDWVAKIRGMCIGVRDEAVGLRRARG